MHSITSEVCNLVNVKIKLIFKKSMCQNSDNDNKNLHVIVNYPIHETGLHSCSYHKQTPIQCGDKYLMHSCLLIHVFSSVALLTSDICYMQFLNSPSSMKICSFKYLIKIKASFSTIAFSYSHLVIPNHTEITRWQNFPTKLH